eukprot:TRINITY_DN6404_c0_g2_i3.p2 TRINITY_DN6404_c0_g2~~TRINITY_DN6404_c0_g2_i3.p2  ORF type:complete len:441 (+),score=79.99 TRINITY_DN6404_c0_g2_i3:2662-3984(+)
MPAVLESTLSGQSSQSLQTYNGRNPNEVSIRLLEESDNQKGGVEKYQNKHYHSLCQELFAGNLQVLINSKLNILLICLPFAIAAKYLHWGDGVLFVLCLLALCPLAERLGYLTEQLALHTNDTLGGLLNVTFGNAPETIVCVCAIRQNAVRIVQLTLVGSIISNLLMVLGSSLLVGGYKNGPKPFKSRGLVMNFTMLIVGVGFVCMPRAVMHDFLVQINSSTNPADSQIQSLQNQVIMLSRYFSLLMLACYVLYIIYEFLQHSGHDNCGDYLHDEDDEEEEEYEVGIISATIWLAVAGFLVAWLSDMLVGALLGSASRELRLPVAFMTIALVPIVGNAAEHAGAIMFAYKNKVELALSVAVGSPTQLLMFVLPLCVIIAWPMKVDLSLNFEMLETTVVVVGVVIAVVSMLDYRTNWAKGALMLLIYFAMAGAYFVHVGYD